MNKLQISTTAGLGGLIAALNKLFALFGEYTMVDIGQAFASIPIADAGVAVVGVIVSVYMLLYDEDKKIPETGKEAT